MFIKTKSDNFLLLNSKYNINIKMTKSEKHAKINEEFIGSIYGEKTFPNVFIYCRFDGNYNHFNFTDDTF